MRLVTRRHEIFDCERIRSAMSTGTDWNVRLGVRFKRERGPAWGETRAPPEGSTSSFEFGRDYA